jgi:hypothetical protein
MNAAFGGAGDAAVTLVVVAVVGNRQGLLEARALGTEGYARRIAQAHRVDFPVVGLVAAVGLQLGAMDGTTARLLRLDDLARLGRRALGQVGAREVAFRVADVQARQHDVAAGRIARQRRHAVGGALFPVWVDRIGQPWMLGSRTGVGRGAYGVVQVAVAAGDAAERMVADRLRS